MDEEIKPHEIDEAQAIYRASKRENTMNDKKFIPNRGKMDGYYEGVPFFCYWLSIAHQKGLKFLT